MTRLEALVSLRDAVADGRTPEAHEITSALRPLYSGGEPIVPYFRMACDADDLCAEGAAIALFNAVLPGWVWAVSSCGVTKETMDTPTAMILPRKEVVSEDETFEAAAETPARALLLATLNALIAKEQDQ